MDPSAAEGSAGRRRRGALEQQVLDCLAGTDAAATPGDVQRSLGGGLAYTTVMTTLVRLHQKGALTRERSGRSYRYRPAGDPDAVAANVAAHQMHRLLAAADREQVLSRFVEELDPADEALLAALLGKVPAPTAPEDEPGR